MGCFWPELVQFVHGVAAGLADNPLLAKMLILFFADKTKGVPDVLLIVYVNVAVGERGVNVTLGAVGPKPHVAVGNGPVTVTITVPVCCCCDPFFGLTVNVTSPDVVVGFVVGFAQVTTTL